MLALWRRPWLMPGGPVAGAVSRLHFGPGGHMAFSRPKRRCREERSNSMLDIRLCARCAPSRERVYEHSNQPP